ncbi:MAG: hypothetical protein JXR51_04110 [Bacteroidales bacterium]|nr:hypothetical protein [Bacteroidales bacterium]
MRIRSLCFILMLIFANYYPLFANNIQVSNINLTNKNTVSNYITVNFDLSWENSWRINTGASNWDAAWIFIKFRQEGGVWQHATLSSIDENHIAVEGSTIDAVSDGKGVFIYRADNGSGNNNWPNMGLRWEYGTDGISDNATNIEIKVFAIEMVYVPQGQFYVGDGSSTGRLWNLADVNTNPALISTTPVVIKCEDPDISKAPMDEQLEGDGILVVGNGGIDSDGNTAIDNPNFPTGYNAFYCMKYEISNQQMADFLNTLTREEQNSRTYFDILSDNNLHPFPINHTNQPESRNSVRCKIVGEVGEPLHFFCDLNNNGIENDPDDGKYIAICNLGWPDGCAFSDWAGLRPMTELEFEKACRGPEYPIANEYAWHNINIYGNSTTEYIVNNLGEINSYPSNPGTGINGNAEYKFTTGHDTEHDAPLRCGIFATSSSDRINAGASYYGIMDLSGTMAERTVSIGHVIGRSFQGTNGDGILTSIIGFEGNANNPDWPGFKPGEESHGIIPWFVSIELNEFPGGFGFRGGDWNDDAPRLQVSDRFYAALDPFDSSGNIGSGFRAVRSAE